MNLSILTPPTLLDEPVSMAEAYAFLKLGAPPDGPDDDASTVSTLIVATRELAETQSGRQQARKQFALSMDAFPVSGYSFSLPYGNQYADPFLAQFKVGPSFIELLDPLVSVDSFVYFRQDGSSVTLVPGTDYVMDPLKHPGVVCPPYGKTWPGDANYPSSAVQITFTAGFTPANVSTSIKQGMLLLISQIYYDRIPFKAVRYAAEIPLNVTALLSAKKLWRF